LDGSNVGLESWKSRDGVERDEKRRFVRRGLE
jgi:hypothetical protein